MDFAKQNEEILTEDNDGLKGKYLTFFANQQLFGIPIAEVVQIIGMQQITPVPEFPEYAKGIINLRGNIIPIIDVRCRFHMQEIPYDEHTCIIVTNIRDLYIGFVVDTVDEVTTIDDGEISPPPKVSADYSNAYLTGIGKCAGKVVLLLDAQKILSDSVIESLSGVNTEEDL